MQPKQEAAMVQPYRVFVEAHAAGWPKPFGNSNFNLGQTAGFRYLMTSVTHGVPGTLFLPEKHSTIQINSNSYIPYHSQSLPYAI